MDACVCMGASIGVLHGMGKSGLPEPAVATIGDSTFFHAGLPPLLNMVHNKGVGTVIIMDNSTTAMTGHQEHPGSGKTLMGDRTKDITVEQVAAGVGVERVRVVAGMPTHMRCDDYIVQEKLSPGHQRVVVQNVKRCSLNPSFLERQRHRFLEVAVVILLDQVRDYLGIGLRLELMPFAGELAPQAIKIAYHPLCTTAIFPVQSQCG
jgi:TPP-dependent indolepyruvate ferredoxin oxidoreductase alpha subunit